MKIEGEVFYLLETEEEKHVLKTEDKAVEKMKEDVGGRQEVNEDDVMIWKVDTSGEDWKIKQVPWSKIAMQMIRS